MPPVSFNLLLTLTLQEQQQRFIHNKLENETNVLSATSAAGNEMPNDTKDITVF